MGLFSILPSVGNRGFSVRVVYRRLLSFIRYVVRYVVNYFPCCAPKITDDEGDLTEDQKRQIEEMKKELSGIIERVNSDLPRNYSKIRTAYVRKYDLSDLDPLRDEICLCITFGLNQAAITLTNHMLECLVKSALIHSEARRQSGNHEVPDTPTPQSMIDYLAEAKKKYANNSLENNINAACTQGRISKEEKRQLKGFRDRFRDAFGHADPDKTFGDSEVSVQAMKLGAAEEEGGVSVGPRESVQIADFLMTRGIHQVELARFYSADYFLNIDDLVHKIFDKVYPNTGASSDEGSDEAD